MPFWRAFFSHFYTYALFRELKTLGTRSGYPLDYAPGFLEISFVLLSLATRLHTPYNLLGLLTFLPFIPVVIAARELNDRYQTSVLESRNEAYSTANIITVIGGSVLLFVVIVGSFL